mmetsp:Transcript_8799/g.21666  ORF Transcript_8799/g.21666 Transcript_8799/m.21666 type:complete len:202 (+) Transcript_8799:3033-3638(+)
MVVEIQVQILDLVFSIHVLFVIVGYETKSLPGGFCVFIRKRISPDPKISNIPLQAFDKCHSCTGTCGAIPLQGAYKLIDILELADIDCFGQRRRRACELNLPCLEAINEASDGCVLGVGHEAEVDKLPIVPKRLLARQLGSEHFHLPVPAVDGDLKNGYLQRRVEADGGRHPAVVRAWYGSRDATRGDGSLAGTMLALPFR